MSRARTPQEGSGSGHHVGTRTNVGVGAVFGDIVDSATDNRLRCQRCNGTMWEIKATHYVDRDETHVMVLHSGNEASGTADCLITKCLVCGAEHTWDVDTTKDWTDQGA